MGSPQVTGRSTVPIPPAGNLENPDIRNLRQPPRFFAAGSRFRQGGFWLAVGLLSFLLVLFPGGIKMELWGAPLESSSACLTILAAWLACWAGWGLNLERFTKIAILAGLLLLAVLKIAVWMMLPDSGVEGHISDPANSSSRAVVSPLRPVGPHGLPVFRSLSVPPHFVNNIRLYDFYQEGAPDRHDYPVWVELCGNVAMAGHDPALAPAVAVVDPALTVERLGEVQKFHFTGHSTTARPVGSGWLVQQPAQGIANHIQSWRLLRDTGLSSMSYLSTLNLLSRAWNVAMVAFVAGMWISLIASSISANSRLRRITVLAFPLVAAALAAAIPVRGTVPFNQLIAAGGLLVLLICVGLYAGRLLAAQNYRWLHATLVLCWAIVASRFFIDRYPDGFAILAAGSDTLFHYTFASEILQGDWLHRLDAPFSRQFFMRYFIAAAMLIIGEGPVWTMLINAILYAVIGLQMASILRMCGSRFWPAVPALWLVFAAVSPFRIWIPTLFPEVLSIVFLLAAAVQWYRWHFDGRTSLVRLLAGGIWFGLAIYTRNNFILSLPLILLLVFCDFRSPGRPTYLRPAVFLAVLSATMIGLVGLRNTLLAPDAPFALLLSQEIKAAALYQGFIPEFIGDADLINRLRGKPLKDQFLHSLIDRPTLYLRYVLDRVVVLFGGPATVEPNLLSSYPRYSLIHFLLFFGLLVRTFGFGFRALDFPAAFAYVTIIPQVLLILLLIGYVGEGYRFLLPCYPLVIILLLMPNGPSGTYFVSEERI